jgi:hypothetical protein
MHQEKSAAARLYLNRKSDCNRQMDLCQLPEQGVERCGRSARAGECLRAFEMAVYTKTIKCKVKPQGAERYLMVAGMEACVV